MKESGGSLVPRVSPHPDKKFVGARGEPRKETRVRGSHGAIAVGPRHVSLPTHSSWHIYSSLMHPA